jgi:folate-binding protein YgfZ
MSSALAADHARSGAVLEGGLPSSYPRGAGAEYRTLREGCGLLDLQDRGVLVVEGPERLGFLQRILSQEVKSLRDGEGARAALMDPKGHLQAVLRILVTPSACILETHTLSLETLQAGLEHYKVGTPVRFRRDGVAVLGLLGPASADILAGLGVEAGSLPPEGHSTAAIGGEEVRVSSTKDLPGGGFVIHARPGGAHAVWRALLEGGAEETGRRALDVLRIERGCPWFPQDMGPENLLHETGLVGELHGARKGCYIGQEVVARLEARGGHVNKLLRGLKLGAPASPGDLLEVGGEGAGVLTTTGISPALGPIAMGYVRRPYTEPGTRVRVGSEEAEVTSLPFPEP